MRKEFKGTRFNELFREQNPLKTINSRILASLTGAWKKTFKHESLILAQDERWRRA